MPAPMGKHWSVRGGKRPWNVSMVPLKSSYMTAKMELERKICLECRMPQCEPLVGECPLKRVGGKK